MTGTVPSKAICYGLFNRFLYLFLPPDSDQHHAMTLPQAAPPSSHEPIYQRLAAHYRSVIQAGSLAPGDRMPSLRVLMQKHDVSLSTALQLSRQLESEGWLEARPRSGYFVRHPRRSTLARLAEPKLNVAPDPAQYVGIHTRVSEFVTRRRSQPIALNFSAARCPPELYPGTALRNAAIRVLRRKPDIFVDPSPARGSQAFRTVLARRAVAMGMALSPDDIQVTNGCIEALNIALRAVAQPGDTIAVESPTFYGLLQILESLNMRALEIPTSSETGLSVEALELALRTYPGIKAVVVVPHLQNPLGSIMPDGHKQALLSLCESHDIALIEDDTYSELVDHTRSGAKASPPRAIKSWDTRGQVIFCASLHKILAPDLRLGWISAGRWQARVEMLKYTQTRNNEALGQLAAAEFMASSGYDRHLRSLRSKLAVQRAWTAESIATCFPAGTRLNLPEGGLALWVELPQQLSSRPVFDQALEAQILIAPGWLFSNSQRFDHYLRISCGWPYSTEVDKGLRKLGSIVSRLAEQAGSSSAAKRY